jgi:hypothetical protein
MLAHPDGVQGLAKGAAAGTHPRLVVVLDAFIGEPVEVDTGTADPDGYLHTAGAKVLFTNTWRFSVDAFSAAVFDGD